MHWELNGDLMADLGTDLSCVLDSPPEMSEVSGRTCLAQAIARRLITPRGRLIDDADYGYDLSQYINDDLSTADIARIQFEAESECVKDERVLGAKVVLTVASQVMTVIVTLEDSSGPFTLVLAINDVTVQLLTVSQ